MLMLIKCAHDPTLDFLLAQGQPEGFLTNMRSLHQNKSSWILTSCFFVKEKEKSKKLNPITTHNDNKLDRRSFVSLKPSICCKAYSS